MWSLVHSGHKLTVWHTTNRIFPYQSKVTKINGLLTFESIMQKADQPDLIFVHLTDTRPLVREWSICPWRKWERVHTGYLLFISEIRQPTACTIQQNIPQNTHALAGAKWMTWPKLPWALILAPAPQLRGKLCVKLHIASGGITSAHNTNDLTTLLSKLLSSCPYLFCQTNTHLMWHWASGIGQAALGK